MTQNVFFVFQNVMRFDMIYVTMFLVFHGRMSTLIHGSSIPEKITDPEPGRYVYT